MLHQRSNPFLSLEQGTKKPSRYIDALVVYQNSRSLKLTMDQRKLRTAARYKCHGNKWHFLSTLALGLYPTVSRATLFIMYSSSRVDKPEPILPNTWQPVDHEGASIIVTDLERDIHTKLWTFCRSLMEVSIDADHQKFLRLFAPMLVSMRERVQMEMEMSDYIADSVSFVPLSLVRDHSFILLRLRIIHIGGEIYRCTWTFSSTSLRPTDLELL